MRHAIPTHADIVPHLDAARNNKYGRTPDTLAAWASASRLERAPQRSKASANGGNTPPPPANPNPPPAH